VPISVMGRKIDLVVTSTTPTADAVIVTDQTQVTVGEQVKEAPRAIPRIAYEDIGGLRPVIQKVREMIELPLSIRNSSNDLASRPQRGPSSRTTRDW